MYAVGVVAISIAISGRSEQTRRIGHATQSMPRIFSESGLSPWKTPGINA